MIKRVLLLSVFVFACSVATAAHGATIREYPQLFRSTRAMGMGGTSIAIGGTVDSMLANPAGLGTLSEADGWEVNLLRANVGFGTDTPDFVGDMQDAFDTEDLDLDGDDSDDQVSAVVDVFEKYQGKNQHADVADLTSVGRNYGKIAFGVGGLGNFTMNAKTHYGLGSEAFLETNASATYGGLAGMSYQVGEKIYAGLSVKLLHRESLVHNFSALELVENQGDLGDYITDEMKQSGDAFGVDTGLLWKFSQDSSLKPSFGVSILNIGNLNFGDAGEIPMTFNFGFAINPDIKALKSLTLGIDYVDLFGAYEEDGDFAKRLRLGGELSLVDGKIFGAMLRAGLYQGYPTFGLEARIFFVTLAYVSYTEEIGAYSGQEKDTRHMLTLNIGW